MLAILTQMQVAMMGVAYILDAWTQLHVITIITRAAVTEVASISVDAPNHTLVIMIHTLVVMMAVVYTPDALTHLPATTMQTLDVMMGTATI